MQILIAGALYLVLVFGAGFVLGIIRTLSVGPRFGTRVAELIETPLARCHYCGGASVIRKPCPCQMAERADNSRCDPE